MNTSSPEDFRTEPESMRARWQEAQRFYETVTDALGLEVDEGIREACMCLRCFDIETEQSCEGHEDGLKEKGNESEEFFDGTSYPWVRISQQKIILDGDIETVDKELLRQVKDKNAEYYNKITTLLSEFYQDSIPSFDTHLVLSYLGFDGTFNILSQGTRNMENLTLEEKKIKLKEYQAEMERFTRFMKSKIFPENNT